MSIETLTLKANDSMIVAVNWLNRVHVQLMEYCQKYSITMPSLKYFLVKDLPLESSHQFKIWFIDLWNLVLIEEFKKELDGKCSFCEDPVQIVIRSWPWKDVDGGFNNSLRPLIRKQGDPHDIEDEIFNKDPLVSMILCFKI